jgi:hypothetical protein
MSLSFIKPSCGSYSYMSAYINVHAARYVILISVNENSTRVGIFGDDR